MSSVCRVRGVGMLGCRLVEHSYDMYPPPHTSSGLQAGTLPDCRLSVAVIGLCCCNRSLLL